MNTVVLDKKLITPSKIICIGRNYVDHITELGNDIPDEMVVFLKPNSALSNDLLSVHHEPLHYEAEICLLIMNGAIDAIGVGLDLTKRQLQNTLKSKGLPWERAKAFDGGAVMSEFVHCTSACTIDSLSLLLTIDGELKQRGGVELMMYKPQQIVETLKQSFTLNDGDIIMTGTPKGVGVIESGARFNAQLIHDDRVLVNNSWIAK